jgi:hypothetical protein
MCLYLLCFVLFVLCFCVVSFTYIYSDLFCLYWCKDYCHRVTTQLQLAVIIIIIIIIIITNKTITDKQNKYQELANEICAMWKQNTAQVISLVISSMRVMPKSLPKSLKRLNLHPNTYIQMQKSVILGTCSIVRNFLNYK